MPLPRPFPPELSSPQPAALRTLFAITLQLGRCFPELCALVRAHYQGDHLGIRRSTRALASGILRGARDRSRDRPLRTLHDQQSRTEPLRRLRPSRPGRGPAAVAARRRRRGAKVTAN